MALSLSFDDARASNTAAGIPLLNQYGVKATFFVLPEGVEENPGGWKKAVKSGHEIGNHSFSHPCSGNFLWTRDNALEDYTPDRMKGDLLKANQAVKQLLGADPVVFAYPCGQTFVGKGARTQSYVPLVAELFLAGRGWMDEAPVDPWYCDIAQLTGIEMDNKDFEELLPLIESALKNGQWLILAGHETGEGGYQTTRLKMLEQLCQYARDPANGIWIAPVGTVARYVKERRETMADSIHFPQLIRQGAGDSLVLTAQHGKGIGPRIEYMPEWKAFGWFTAKDRVEWDIEVNRSGIYEVTLEWSVSDQEAGKTFVLEAGRQRLEGKVGKTGSWETYKKTVIGRIKLGKGYQRVIFRPATEFEGEALLDLREITLKL